MRNIQSLETGLTPGFIPPPYDRASKASRGAGLGTCANPEPGNLLVAVSVFVFDSRLVDALVGAGSESAQVGKTLGAVPGTRLRRQRGGA